MLRLLVVDDEPLARRALRQVLDTRADVRVVAECADLESTAAWLSEVDGVLLDIEMPGRSGLEWARARHAAPLPAVVFVTAFDRYAVPAFATEALDYLCKPVTAAELDRALARMREHVARHQRPTVATEAAPGGAASGTSSPPRLLARLGRTEELIAPDDISCIEADDVYAAVHVGGRRLLVRQSLAALAEGLPADAFRRVHRQWIVHRAAVRALRSGSAGVRLVLHSGQVVPVSRRSAAAVRAWLRGGGAGPTSGDPG